MDLKFFALLAVAFFVSVANSTEDVYFRTSSTSQQELNKAVEELQIIRRKSAEKISVLKPKVYKEISSALKPVTNHVTKLISDIFKNEKEAKEQKKDISKCVKEAQEVLKHLTTHKLKQCRNPKELSEAEQEVEVLDHLIRSLEESGKKCSNGSGDVDACIKKHIKESSEKAKKVEEKISKEVKQIDPVKQGQCARAEAPKLEKRLAAAESKWKQCLKKHL